MSVAVWIDGSTHRLVMLRIVEQASHTLLYLGLVGADKLYCASLHGFGAFGSVAHHKHRLAQRRCLLLHAARIGQ